MHTCICVYMCTHICTYIHACPSLYKYIYIYIYIVIMMICLVVEEASLLLEGFVFVDVVEAPWASVGHFWILEDASKRILDFLNL